MSNIIPIVSSSPPPLDDDGGWDDDDDDFGNFASAPSNFHTAEGRGDSDAFEVDWSSADALKDDGLPQDSQSTHDQKDVAQSSLNGFKADLPGLKSDLCLDSEKVFNGPNHQSFSAIDTENADEEKEQFPGNFSDIPISTSKNCSTLEDAHLIIKPTADSAVQENSSGVIHSDENLAFAAFKITESGVSSSSIGDSGVFSSDLSPSSQLEGSTTTLQENCDTSDSPKFETLTKVEHSENVVDSDSYHEHSEISQETRNSSPTQAEPRDGSCEDNINDNVNDDEGGDWGDFNDAFTNVDDSSAPDEIPSFANFEDLAHSTVTVDDESCEVQVEDSSQNLDLNDNKSEKTETGQKGCENSSSNLSKCEERAAENCENSDSLNLAVGVAAVDETQSKQNAVLEPGGDGCESSNSLTEGDESFAVSEKEKLEAPENAIPVSTTEAPLPARGVCVASEDESLPCKEEGNVNTLEESEKDGNSSADLSEAEVTPSHLDKDESIPDEEKDDINKVVKESDGDNSESDDGHREHIEERLSPRATEEENGGISDAEVVDVTQTRGDENEASAGKHTEDDTQDEEFGFFSGESLDKKESDLSEEVTPITFRTSECEDDLEGNDEDDNNNGDDTIKEQPPPFNDDDDDDDFGDFGDFSSTQAAGLSEAADDDFADFDSGLKGGVEKFDPPPDIDGGDDDDDFGDFGDASASGDVDAGWADFGSSAPATAEQPDSFGSSSSSLQPSSDFAETAPLPVKANTDQSKSKVVLALEKCFPVPVVSPTAGLSSPPPAAIAESTVKDAAKSDSGREEEGEGEGEITALDVVVELGLANPLEAKQQTWTVVQHPAKRDPRVRVWSQMKDVDASHALGYVWPTSHCSQEVFSTLHIDTQNILFTQKKQAVPFFASGLGILEPTRGGNPAADSKKEKINVMGGAPLQPTLLDQGGSSQQMPVTATQDIPPVDFDWSVSGLTNPLTANTLDLDFLVVQGSDSCEKTADEWDWVFKSDADDAVSSQPGLQPLEDMLKKSTPTAKLATQENLSAEAQRILAKMSDLSFMQSKVLMFPVKQ